MGLHTSCKLQHAVVLYGRCTIAAHKLQDGPVEARWVTLNILPCPSPRPSSSGEFLLCASKITASSPSRRPTPGSERRVRSLQVPHRWLICEPWRCALAIATPEFRVRTEAVSRAESTMGPIVWEKGDHCRAGHAVRCEHGALRVEASVSATEP